MGGSLTRGPGALAAGPPASRRPQAVDDVVRDAGALGHREHEVAGDGARVPHQEGPVALPLQQRHRLGAAQSPPVPARPVLGVELPGHGGRPPAGRARCPRTTAAPAPLRAQPRCHPKWRPLPLTSPTGRDRTRGTRARRDATSARAARRRRERAAESRGSVRRARTGGALLGAPGAAASPRASPNSFGREKRAAEPGSSRTRCRGRRRRTGEPGSGAPSQCLEGAGK